MSEYQIRVAEEKREREERERKEAELKQYLQELEDFKKYRRPANIVKRFFAFIIYMYIFLIGMAFCGIIAFAPFLVAFEIWDHTNFWFCFALALLPVSMLLGCVIFIGIIKLPFMQKLEHLAEFGY